MKEELPSILISDGWITNENDGLVEVVIPSTVDTYQAPTKITFKGETLNWIPSTAAALLEFEAPNATQIPLFANYTALRTVSFPNLVTLNIENNIYFKGCTALENVHLPKLETINAHVSGGGTFYGCTNLKAITLESLKIIYDNWTGSGAFWGCTGLKTVNLPKISTIMNASTSSTAAAFYNCTNLENVTLGSSGHPVITIDSKAFNSCTQSGLTITVYTSGGAALSGAPWGATNATIVYESA